MGKKMDELKALKNKRDIITNSYQNLMNTFGAYMSPEYARFNEINQRTYLACIDKEIRVAEDAALEERAQELAASMLGDMTKQATRAGKELAAAF